MRITLSDFARLGEEIADAENAASDLWTWLPSHEVTTKHHGDYASEFRPSTADVMKEAAMYFAHLKRTEVPPTTKEREWFTRCACGNSCEENEGGI